MPCNCNTASKTCDPCEFCTPSGVTNLPQCEPIDPCPEIIDSCCVLFSGVDMACFDVSTGDTLCDIISRLVKEYIPDCTTTTSTSTTTTTTSTSTTTTTTTLAPCICESFVVDNISETTQYITYTDCNRITHVDVPVLVNINITICVCSNLISYPERAVVVYPAGSGCISTTTTSTTTTSTTTTTTSTTTTTTTDPCPVCHNFYILNLTSGHLTGSYEDCENGGAITVISLKPTESITICGCRNTIDLPDIPGVSITDLGTECGPTTTTTSTTSTTTTTTTSTTTTTTTEAPICNCYYIYNSDEETSATLPILNYKDCLGIEQSVEVNVGGSLAFCAILGSVTYNFPATIINNGECIGDCTLPTSTTTTTPLVCEYWTNNNIGISAFYDWIDCDGNPHLNEGINPAISICAESGTVSYISGATLTLNGTC